MQSRIYGGPWSGAVTESSVAIRASVFRNVSTAAISVSRMPTFSVIDATVPADLVAPDPQRDYRNLIVSGTVNRLSPNTHYFYRLELDGVAEIGRISQFRTAPPAGTKADLRFAFASCSGNDAFFNIDFPDPEAYLALTFEADARDLQFFFHLGDLHYGNIKDAVIAKRLERYEWMLARDEPGDLFRRLPLVYVWDDHDFIGNSSNGGNPDRREAALSALVAYRAFVPHYPGPDEAEGIFHSFEFGRVLFIVTDLRYNRTSRTATAAPTMLGEAQRAWLFSELARASTVDLVVLASSVPWIGPADPGEDHWAGYAEERRLIAEFIKANQITNLCMISGDAHMLAIDDGSHSGYAADGRGGFPVCQSASIESMKSEKGGPYSIGDDDGSEGWGIKGKRQYTICEIEYPRDADGQSTGTPTVRWTCRRAAHGATSLAGVSDVITYTFPAANTFAGF